MSSRGGSEPSLQIESQPSLDSSIGSISSGSRRGSATLSPSKSTRPVSSNMPKADPLSDEVEIRIRRLEELERSLKLKEQMIEERDREMQRALKLIEERARAEDQDRVAREELMRLAVGEVSARSGRSEEAVSPVRSSKGGSATTTAGAVRAESSPAVAVGKRSGETSYSSLPSARAQPPTARSARESPIPKDAPRIVQDGKVWVQLWDPEQSAYYWYCQDTQEAQWDKPGTGGAVAEPTSADLEKTLTPISARTHPPTARSARESPIPLDAARVVYEGEVWVQLWDPEQSAYYWYCLDSQAAQWDKPGEQSQDVLESDQGYESGGAMTDYSTDRNESVVDYTDSEYDEGAPTWQEFWDEQAQAKYWYNYVTGEATWARPEGVEGSVTGESLEQTATTKANTEGNELADDWMSYVDENTGQEYWYNSVTGETSWS